MRNLYAGNCFVCGQRVAEREGVAVHRSTGWMVRHEGCAEPARRVGKAPELGMGYAGGAELGRARDHYAAIIDKIEPRRGGLKAPPSAAGEIRMSICTYQGGTFDVMIQDAASGRGLCLSGSRVVTEDELDLINEIAPACVWTTYKRKDT